MEQLQDALDGGGELVLGGDVPEGKGHFMQPTIVANPAQDSRVAREETFGPLLPVWRVSDLDEAIRRSNDTEYGLGASRVDERHPRRSTASPTRSRPA